MISPPPHVPKPPSATVPIGDRARLITSLGGREEISMMQSHGLRRDGKCIRHEISVGTGPTTYAIEMPLESARFLHEALGRMIATMEK